METKGEEKKKEREQRAETDKWMRDTEGSGKKRNKRTRIS